jgi:hypothetical protein
MHFNFIASNQFDLSSLNSVGSFVDSYNDFQTVWLADEHELKLLLDLMGLPTIESKNLDNKVFTKYWDISEFKLPEFNVDGFDKFYENWILVSGRDNEMNEYGSLIFLQGLSSQWNKLKYRMIIKEDSAGT